MGGSLVLADAISSIGNFIDVFITVYMLLIFGYIIMSWVKLPVLALAEPGPAFPLRRLRAVPASFPPLLPPLGPLDISPIVAVFSLIFFDRLVQAILDRLH